VRKCKNRLFLPPNTTSLSQAMNQGTIAIFKAYYVYIRKTFEPAIDKIIGDDAISLTELWKNYNIRSAIENIHYALQQIMQMHEVSKHILPHCENSDFEEKTVIEKMTNFGRVL
jgi:hypothetical protein